MTCAEASILHNFLHLVTKAMFYKERVSGSVHDGFCVYPDMKLTFFSSLLTQQSGGVLARFRLITL